MTRRLLLLVMLLSPVWGYTQPGDEYFRINDFIEVLEKNHPVIKQAKLLPEKARFDLMSARGAFDPKLKSDFSEKTFNDKPYWNALDASLSLPVWIGDFKAGYERGRGDFLNPESRTADQGLLYAGYSVPLGAGLFTDERRNALQQAKVYVDASVAEQTALVNKMLTKAISDYWNWYYTYRQLEFVRQGFTLAETRFTAIRELYKNGNNSGLDTLEAFTNLVLRQNQLQQAELDYLNARLALSVHLWNDENLPVNLGIGAKPESLPEDAYQKIIQMPDTLRESAARIHPEIRKIELQGKQLGFEKRYRAEMLKPVVNVNYNFLTSPIDPAAASTSIWLNNYKFGVTAEMPLLLRKERGKLNSTKTLLKINTLKLNETRRNVDLSVQVSMNEIKNLRTQVENQRRLVTAYEQLVIGEQEKFLNGESSVFLINSRETTLVSAGVKLAELEMKLAKSIAYLYNASGSVNWRY